MKFLYGAALVASLSVPALAQGIKPYVAPKGEFSVAFANKPTVETETQKDPEVGTINIQTFTDDKGDVSYVVIPMTMSNIPSFAGLPSKPLFDEYEKSFVGELGGKVSARREFKTGGYPTREVIVDVGNLRFVLRVVVAKQRLFQMFAGGLKKDLAANPKKVTGFLSSFKILKP